MGWLSQRSCGNLAPQPEARVAGVRHQKLPPPGAPTAADTSSLRIASPHIATQSGPLPRFAASRSTLGQVLTLWPSLRQHPHAISLNRGRKPPVKTLQTTWLATPRDAAQLRAAPSPKEPRRAAGTPRRAPHLKGAAWTAWSRRGVRRCGSGQAHFRRAVGVCALAPAARALLRWLSGRLRRVGAGWVRLPRALGALGSLCATLQRGCRSF
jgi:hypothetical protein